MNGAAQWILLTTMTGAAALTAVAGSSVSPRFFAPSSNPPVVAHAAAHADMARQSSTIEVPPDRDGTDDSDTDLYGNDVTDAVATYQLDAAGSLYETHSPRTELPRLKPPRG